MKIISLVLVILGMCQISLARGQNRGGQHWLNSEEVKSITLDQHLQGRGNIIKIRRQLGISGQYRGTLVKSVIVIAKTKMGRGNMKVLGDGMTLSRQIVGQSLSAYELPVNEFLGPRGIRALQLETNGNFLVHSIAVVLKKSHRGPGGRLLIADATVNRMQLSLQARNQSQMKTQCLQELNQRMTGMQRIRRVSSNGVSMNIFRGDRVSLNQACDFITQQAVSSHR